MQRRFPHMFVFEDYSEVELRRLYRARVVARGFTLPSAAQCGMNVARVMAARLARGRGHRGFGNCGLVHNKVGQAVQAFMLRKSLEHARLGAGGLDLSNFAMLSKEDILGRKPSLHGSPVLADMDAFVGSESNQHSIHLQCVLKHCMPGYESQ